MARMSEALHCQGQGSGQGADRFMHPERMCCLTVVCDVQNNSVTILALLTSCEGTMAGSSLERR
jgi:hypothetical protein